MQTSLALILLFGLAVTLAASSPTLRERVRGRFKVAMHRRRRGW